MVRGSSWLNIFSPQNRDYDVKVVPLPIDRDVPASTPPARPAGTEVMLTWFGDPQSGFGGMGQSGRLSFSSGGYAYEPTGAAESLEGVRIPIWSTKCLTARWFGGAPSVIASDLKEVGPDAVEGTVTNQLDVPLKDAWLAFSSQVYELGTIAPHATVRVDLSRSPRHLSGLLQERLQKIRPNESWNTAGFHASRPDLILELMFSGTASAAEGARPMTNSPLHYLDSSGLLRLGRPVLFAQAARPGSRLILGNAVRPPKIEQLTMLRVILDQPADAASTAAKEEEKDGAKAKEPAKP
jgi:hypothetical protein